MTTLEQKAAEALRQVSPALCKDIDSILDQGGGMQDVFRVVENVRRQMGDQKPIYTNTVETMIEGYVNAELKKRKEHLTKPA